MTHACIGAVKAAAHKRHNTATCTSVDMDSVFLAACAEVRASLHPDLPDPTGNMSDNAHAAAHSPWTDENKLFLRDDAVLELDPAPLVDGYPIPSFLHPLAMIDWLERQYGGTSLRHFNALVRYRAVQLLQSRGVTATLHGTIQAEADTGYAESGNDGGNRLATTVSAKTCVG